jgi:hypothetical protein
MLATMALDKLGAHDLADRVDTDAQGDSYDHYGHWWVEAGSLSPDGLTWKPIESYGWWPAHGVGIAEILKITRVEGKLNQGKSEDPHHGEKADTEYHPVLEVDDKDDYEAVRDSVMDKVRTFAKGFSGSWNWRLGWGKELPHLHGAHEEVHRPPPPESFGVAARRRRGKGEEVLRLHPG